MSEEELLEQLVSESNSLSEILRKQGKAVSGNACKILKEKLEKYNIEYSFSQNYSKNLKKKPIEYYLQENIKCDSQKLKKRLIKEGLKKDICECCGQDTTWNGKPLVLQLDHINGDHHDNRLENLRIVCPNCHSQTDTFCTRKKRKTCPDCGAEISSRASYCRKCAPKHKKDKKASSSIGRT